MYSQAEETRRLWKDKWYPLVQVVLAKIFDNAFKLHFHYYKLYYQLCFTCFITSLDKELVLWHDEKR